jgi:hypothetical protein
VHWGLYSQTINKVYFPDVVDIYYWSSTTYASSTDNAWAVLFRNGGIVTNRNDKSDSYSVRAVRGEPWALADFVDNGNGTVTDTATGLMWQQAESDEMWWEEAVTYCEQLELAGYDDWRLPNINELQSIVDYNKVASEEDPAIDTNFFPNLLGNSYWSATTYTRFTDQAWLVDFFTGNYGNFGKHIKGRLLVRAVRGGL